jgi:hypothetical protein
LKKQDYFVPTSRKQLTFLAVLVEKKFKPGLKQRKIKSNEGEKYNKIGGTGTLAPFLKFNLKTIVKIAPTEFCNTEKLSVNLSWT